MKLSPLTEEFLDYVVATLIVAFLAFAWWAITDAVENPVQADEYIMEDQRPDIPDCDKELYDRITEGCNDEDTK